MSQQHDTATDPDEQLPKALADMLYYSRLAPILADHLADAQSTIYGLRLIVLTIWEQHSPAWVTNAADQHQLDLDELIPLLREVAPDNKGGRR